MRPNAGHRKPWTRFGALALWALVVGFESGRTFAVETTASPADPISSGRKAFAREGTFPWYDAQQDALQPMSLSAGFDWPKWKWNLGSILQILVWTALAIGLGVLLLVLIRVARRLREAESPRTSSSAELVFEPERVEALSFLADRSRGDLLGEALRNYQQGNFSEAIIYLFSYQLVRLDKVALIQLTKGKTNRQYLREAAKIEQLGKLLGTTMLTFENVFFGGRALDRAGFEACWNQLTDFESLVAGAAP